MELQKWKDWGDRLIGLTMWERAERRSLMKKTVKYGLGVAFSFVLFFFLAMGSPYAADMKEMKNTGMTNEGQTMVDNGEKMMNEGKTMMDKGQMMVKEGKMKLDKGEKMKSEGQMMLDKGKGMK
jgi:hypothetical protein